MGKIFGRLTNLLEWWAVLLLVLMVVLVILGVFFRYVLGASLGPVGMGFLSNYFTRQAAVNAGVTETTFQALRPFAAQGLHSALYVVPVFGILLGLVLFAASRTVAKDMEKLQSWMRESVSSEAKGKSYASAAD